MHMEGERGIGVLCRRKYPYINRMMLLESGIMKFQLLLFLLHYLLQYSMVQSVVIHNDNDSVALLALKEGLTNGADTLSSWNKSTHYCEWIGVTCSRKHPKRVSALDLSMRDLLGTISPFIGNLTFLRSINLTSSKMYGPIPSSIGFLGHLKYLDLSNNSFGGKITKGLQNCSSLVYVVLSYNNLVGEIPFWLGSLFSLQHLSISNNNLIGSIPASLGNLSSLHQFRASSNNLDGTIPRGLSILCCLQIFDVGGNHLSGTVDHSFYNQSSLIEFSVAKNKLEGSLPIHIGNNLPNLQTLFLDLNHFTGRIPSSISNASNIARLDLGNNKFSGYIPAELGKLCPIYLSMQGNELEATNIEDWEFLKLLSNCSRLEKLQLTGNNLGGTFPSYITNLTTQVKSIYMGLNYLTGSIPDEIGNLVNLVLLSLSGNQLTGVIPESIGKLQRLQGLALSGNMLSGLLPLTIGNLTELTVLITSYNHIQGTIPVSLANLQHLNYIDLSNNNFYGTLPKNIFNIPSLSYMLDLSNNSLTGKLPLEVGSLKAQYLSLSQNKFYGELPKTFSNCESLVHMDLSANLFNGTIPPFLRNLKGLVKLNLSNNNFRGTIPQELSYIDGLQEIYFSNNNLSGHIPSLLQNLSSLFMLDLSFNHLEGPVPTKGVFNNISGLSISGNIGLCGGIPQLLLPMCPPQPNKLKISPLLLKILIVLPSMVIFLISVFSIGLSLRQRVISREKQTMKPMLLEEAYPKVSYAELVKATNGFSAANLLGFGRYGSVYKGTLLFKNKQSPHDHAIKMFNLEVQGTSKSFMAECDALRMIRHRNLISLITCCSSTDFKGNDFKALVFDFMPKGSLEKWLHRDDGPFLKFIERLNITVDMADAIDYLHNNCEPSIIHCDLKPNNILLDDDLVAHVGDFGLAKLLPTSISQQLLNSQSTMGIRGTIGYVAPEYGDGGPVSTQADVYSFGIILLEMFTGKMPTDDMFKDGLTLHTFVEMAFPEKLQDIVDPNMISSSDSDLEIQNEQEGDSWNKINIFLVSIIRVGILCSKQSPVERKSIKDAAIELHSIRDAYRKAH